VYGTMYYKYEYRMYVFLLLIYTIRLIYYNIIMYKQRVAKVATCSSRNEKLVLLCSSRAYILVHHDDIMMYRIHDINHALRAPASLVVQYYLASTVQQQQQQSTLITCRSTCFCLYCCCEE
jgi:predicted acetyltransferase